MNLYPKTIGELQIKLDNINTVNESKLEEIKEWKHWIESNKIETSYECSENEYLKEFSNNNKFALQLWERLEDFEVLKYNLISNHYSEYNDENTKIINDELNQ